MSGRRGVLILDRLMPLMPLLPLLPLMPLMPRSCFVKAITLQGCPKLAPSLNAPLG